MREKLITMTILACFFSLAKAQVVSNGGFEGLELTHNNPDMPQFYTVGTWAGMFGELDTQDPGEGEQSVKITTTKDLEIAQQFLADSVVPGALWQMIPNNISNVENLVSMRFKYKFHPEGGDIAAGMIYIYDTAQVQGAYIILYEGLVEIIQEQTDWTQAIVEITKNPEANGVPNKIEIAFMSSATPEGQGIVTFHEGTTLWIDEVKLSTDQFEGIDEKVKNDCFAYPNPVDNCLNLKSASTISTVEIFTPEGKLLSSCNFDSNQVNITTNNLNSGLYYYKIIEADGKIFTNSFIKK